MVERLGPSSHSVLRLIFITGNKQPFLLRDAQVFGEKFLNNPLSSMGNVLLWDAHLAQMTQGKATALVFAVSQALKSHVAGIPYVLGDLKWGEIWVDMESLGRIFLSWKKYGLEFDLKEGKDWIGGQRTC